MLIHFSDPKSVTISINAIPSFDALKKGYLPLKKLIKITPVDQISIAVV